MKLSELFPGADLMTTSSTWGHQEFRAARHAVNTWDAMAEALELAHKWMMEVLQEPEIVRAYDSVGLESPPVDITLDALAAAREVKE